MALYLQLAYLIICVAEAWLEQVVIWQKNPATYIIYDKKEHARSALYSIVVALFLIATPVIADVHFLSKSVLLIPVILLIRRIAFDYSLKIFRGLRFSEISGNGPVDKFMRNLLGKYGGYKELLALAALIILFNLLFL